MNDDPTIYLSPSTAKRLINDSPRHAWWYHRLLGGHVDPPTSAQERGKIFEAIIFGFDTIQIIEADSFRTKDAQALRDQAREAGKISMLFKDAVPYQQAAGYIKEQLSTRGIVFEGENQVTLKWQKDGVKCKGILDHFIAATGVIYDLKCVTSANPKTIQRQFVDLGWDIQWAAYIEAVELHHPALAGRVSFKFIVCEVEEPYAVTIVEPSGSMRKLGQAKWARAIKTWGECMKSGRWPAYSEDLVRLEATPWQLSNELMEEDDAPSV